MNVIKQIAVNVSANISARAARWLRARAPKFSDFPRVDALTGLVLAPAADVANAVSERAIDYINRRDIMPEPFDRLLKTWDAGAGISEMELLAASKADPEGVLAFLANAAARKVINADVAQRARRARAMRQREARRPAEERRATERQRIWNGVDALVRGGVRKVG